MHDALTVVHGPDPICLEGRHGSRYWVETSLRLTGNAEVDRALACYPLAVFQPDGRDPVETPVVIGIQGIAAPFQWNGFIVPILLDLGIACVLFDAPLAGERSLIRDYPGDVIRQIVPLARRGLRFTTPMASAMMDAVARDVRTVTAFIRDRHGLTDSRIALFGVSMGCLLSALPFTRDGFGERLLCCIGHCDPNLFARSYAPAFTPLLASLPGKLLSRLLSLLLGDFPRAAHDFLSILNDLSRPRDRRPESNPMTYAKRVNARRRVRFLVGRDDGLVHPSDVESCAEKFADGEFFVVPGLGHGVANEGPSFADHVRTFLRTQLGDWRR